MSSYEIKVYKIYFLDCDDFYIGSTKSPLSRRMTEHRAAVRKGSNYKVYNFIRSKNMNFEYILVSSCMVSNKDQQRQFEQSVISEMKPNLNKIRAHTTVEQRREQKKEYRKENKGQIKEQMKEYRDKNKEKLKEYRKENKEQIKEYQKEYQKENKEQIKEYQKEYNKKYRNENKGKISEYYIENKESISEKHKIKIKCPYCDKHTNKSHIARHNKNNKHKKNLYFHFYNFIHS